MPNWLAGYSYRLPFIGPNFIVVADAAESYVCMYVYRQLKRIINTRGIIRSRFGDPTYAINYIQGPGGTYILPENRTGLYLWS